MKRLEAGGEAGPVVAPSRRPVIESLHMEFKETLVTTKMWMAGGLFQRQISKAGLPALGFVVYWPSARASKSNANNLIAVVDLHDCFFKRWWAEKTSSIIAEPIGFRRNTQSIFIEFAVTVLIMKQNDGISSGVEVGEDN